jgi:branched-chain amino acid transport system permease protein
LVFGLTLNVELMISPIVGGRGTIIGPIVGAMVNKPVAELFRGWFSARRGGTIPMLYGLFLIVFVMFIPQGLAGLIYSWYWRLRRGLLANEKLKK